MRTSTRLGGCVLAAALVLSGTPATAAPHRPGNAPGGRPQAPRVVTLITGDTVSILDGGRVGITRDPGRTGVTFVTRRVGTHVHVIPSDALPLLRAGRVDPRLFDVTTLLEFGYDDRRADLPLIVSGTTGNQGARVTHALPAVNGVAARAARTPVFWQGFTKAGGTTRVWLDGLRTPTLDESVPQVGAPAAHQAGFDGTGVTVAVLDTGIDVTHPDLAGRVTASRNFTEGTEDDRDLVGHGTHVASTIAGGGARFRGVAPGARLLNGKVCVVFGCAESWILGGMQWAAESGAAVVNLSLGGPDTPEVDPLEEAVQTLTARHGTLFVIAAGNSGFRGDGSIESPASADAALAVGAVDKSDALAFFSSKGPRVGDDALKPDLTAPGVDITAARGKDGFLGEPGELYMPLSGTSMATPHVAGAAAILAQRRPGWTADRLKAVLVGAAKPNPSLGVYAQGAGRLDVARAIGATVVADPPSISFGRQIWPHDDDAPITRTVTYRNHGPADVVLDLALDATAMFSLSAARVTVPAGGTAAVTVTADTRVGTVDGFHGGRLVASGGGMVLGTSFAVHREVESYDLTIVHKGPDGGLPDFASTLVVTPERGIVDVLIGPDGTGTVRLPKGTYPVVEFQFVSEPRRIPVLVQPKVVLTADRTVTLDARLARPISVTVPNPEATSVTSDVALEFTLPDFTAGIGLLADDFAGISTAQMGPDEAVAGFRSSLTGTWARVDADGRVDGSPFVYHGGWFTTGRLPTGFERRLTQRDLATVRADHAVQGTGTSAWKAAFPLPPGDLMSASAILIPYRLPFSRTEFYTTEGGTRWEQSFDELVFDETGFPVDFVGGASSSPTTYRAGRTTTERWNRAVFGPALGRPFEGFPFVARDRDTMYVFPPLHGDGAGRLGYAALASGRAAVFKDGVLVAEAAEPGGVFDVPAGPGRYRLEVSAVRAANGLLSTRVSAVWTFRSDTTAGFSALPLSSVGFSPPVDDHNVAPAGRLVAVPVTVAAQPGSTAGHVRRLTVQVSFDDGVTWREAPVLGGRVLLVHPRADGFVSLRTTVLDSAGNTAEHTIIRAYRFAR